MRTAAAIVIRMVVGLCSGACTEAAMDPPEPTDMHLFHTELPPIHVEAGEEVVDLCYSWTLDNEEPLYVNEVAMESAQGIHHSNWLWVPDRYFDGPDGLWPCAEREFDQVTAGVVGGVLFGQSTQVAEETQRFLPGVALPLARHTRIVANLHLVNASPTARDVPISLTIRTLPVEEVVTRLSPMILSYGPLAITPHGRSEFTTDCLMGDLHETALDRPMDFEIHYILPHYHAFGDLLRVELVGGTRDGEVIAETHSAIGEPVAIAYDEPVSMAGADGLRLRCGYQNATDDTIYWGNGYGEMCIAFAYTDSPNAWMGDIDGDNRVLGTDAGVTQNTADCRVVTLPAIHTRERF